MSEEMFPELNELEPEVTEIESLCMNCYKEGITRLLLTKIPFYKEVVIMSFSCEHCGFQNNEIQPGGKIQPQGIRLKLQVINPQDLNRKLIKSDFSAVKIPEVDFEVPCQSQKGEVTTVEGIIERVVSGLEQDQEPRRKDHPEVAAQIDAFIDKLRGLKDLKKPFTLEIDDISGNSFIENPLAPSSDPQLKVTYFNRTKDQDHLLGVFEESEVKESEDSKANEGSKNLLKPIEEGSHPYEDFNTEVLRFPTNCPDCSVKCETNMKITRIPHFKEVVIMATNCDSCGHRSNEVKPGGGIEQKGVKIEVSVKTREDFARDVLKSDFCSLIIPELEVEVGPNALGGRFTTVEGILQAMYDQVWDQSKIFTDSQDKEHKDRLDKFFEHIKQVLDSKAACTLVLDDPSGNSYVQALADDINDDQALKISQYVRNHDQNEELGLNDMNTENYLTTINE